jgi:hypothetical protein
MAEIVQFRPRAKFPADRMDSGNVNAPDVHSAEEEDEEIGLLTAIDAAIRDLRDIADRWGEEAARLQALECRLMLERAFNGVG